jgi:catechol 2,3-dioxygenase-like lactoylglutathione lyase family enzyme
MTTRTIDSSTLAPLTLAHIVLRTSDVDEKVDFYTQLLGMRVHQMFPGGAAVLSHDGEHHRIAIIKGSDETAPAQAPGMQHHAWKVGSLDRLLGNYRHNKDAGLEPLMCIHHGGTISIYYRDPDGLDVETFCDAMAPDQAIESLSSPEFLQNPIGVPFDPDDLAARYEAGEPMTTLLAQPTLQDGDLEKLIEKLVGAPA